MKVRFFILGTDKKKSAERLMSELKYVFADHLNDDGDVMAFSEIKEAAASIAKAVKDTHALIFVADSEKFGATKMMLSKAFGFELANNNELLKKAKESFAENVEETDNTFDITHASVPENSRVFVLDDGLYAGFSVANGNQTIILLPYEKDRTSVLLCSQVIPYLNSVYHVSVDTNKFREYNTEILCEALRKNDSKVAMAGTNTASFYKDYIYTREELKEYVTISQLAEKRGSMPPVDYVVNLSITASELLSCPYGIAMSNAFYTGDSPDSEKIVYMAVTNERETSVREVHSFRGEDIQLFLGRCSGDLCRFIADVIENDTNHKSDNENREKAAIRRYKIAIATVAAFIVAISAFCVSYFAVKDYSFSQWSNNFIEWIFPAGNPFAGMFDRFVPGEDEERVNMQTDDANVVGETTEATTEATTEDVTENVTDDTSESATEDETI